MGGGLKEKGMRARSEEASGSFEDQSCERKVEGNGNFRLCLFDVEIRGFDKNRE